MVQECNRNDCNAPAVGYFTRANFGLWLCKKHRMGVRNEHCESCDNFYPRPKLKECIEGYYCPSCLSVRRLNVGRKNERVYLNDL